MKTMFLYNDFWDVMLSFSRFLVGAGGGGGGALRNMPKNCCEQTIVEPTFKLSVHEGMKIVVNTQLLFG